MTNREYIADFCFNVNVTNWPGQQQVVCADCEEVILTYTGDVLRYDEYVDARARHCLLPSHQDRVLLRRLSGE